MIVRAPGIDVDLPKGWEIEIDSGGGEDGQEFQPVTTPRVHIANFPLPAVRGDFGSGAVERMIDGDALICLLEESGSAVGTALYKKQGVPRLTPGDFARNRMQRPIKGQAGAQRFFTAADRAFALYVVLGSFVSRQTMVDRVNEVLAGIRISAGR